MDRAEVEMVRRCRQGDPRAWRAMVVSQGPAVRRLAQRVVGAADADDATQEVFVRVHRSLHSYDASRPLRPWLMQVTWNVCLRRLEQRGRQVPVTGGPPVDALADVSAVAPDRLLARAERAAAVEWAVGLLDAEDRAMVTMRYHEGLSDPEIAEATGRPVGTVKTRLFRARARLRSALGRLGGGGKP